MDSFISKKVTNDILETDATNNTANHQADIQAKNANLSDTELSHQQESEEVALEPIAIVAMSCRFPGAVNIRQFWENLQQGRETIQFFSDEELIAAGVDRKQIQQSNYVKAKGVLDNVEDFDAHFFGYTPNEAELMDPQQRLLLECAWEALEQACLDPDRFQGEIAAYAGVGMNIYLLNNLLAHYQLRESSDFYQMLIGSDKDFAATRLSYKLNLKGPSIALNTACSTSLVAVHYACQSLWDYQCDAALAGGATVLVPQQSGYLYQQGGIPSPDGHCRVFDAQAKGTVPSSGAGVVLLKRLEDAIDAKDQIYAVIKGSAVNNDGADKVGFTAPSVEGQAAVIAEAMEVANVAARSISYVEAHGTATPLGDPIEVSALTLAHQATTEQQAAEHGYCALGSVKSNLGHMDTAAGIAGLIKTALALYHEKIPPSLHYQQPNPQIDFAESPFYVNQTLADWRSGETPRRAGVSSFGIGGTNAHIILEEAPAELAAQKDGANIPPTAANVDPAILPLSAKNHEALLQLRSDLADSLADNDYVLADMAYSLAIGRKAQWVRQALVVTDKHDLHQQLAENQAAKLMSETPKMVFMFPGQGAQTIGMGAELYEKYVTFQTIIDECCEFLIPFIGLDLRQLVFQDYPDEKEKQQAQQQLNQTALTQPALFVIEYALAKLLISWGIKPDAMIGHSLGEYVAACISGVYSWQDGLKLLVKRAQLMQAAKPGAMLAVMTGVQQCEQLLTSNPDFRDLSIAAINANQIGREQCVISGTEASIQAFQAFLHSGHKDANFGSKLLPVSHAFHSPLMVQAAESLTKYIHSSEFSQSPQQASIPFISNISGDWFNSTDQQEAGYWQQHMLAAVNFAGGLDTLCREYPQLILLEVGPGKTLQNLASQVGNEKQHSLACLKAFALAPLEREVLHLTHNLAELWSHGVNLDWDAYYAMHHCHRVALPTYPFQRQRCWIDAPKPSENHSDGHQKVTQQVLDGAAKTDLSDWFSTVIWKRQWQKKPPLQKHSEAILFFSADASHELSSKTNTEAIQQLLDNPEQLITIAVSDKYKQINEQKFAINPEQENDFYQLIERLLQQQSLLQPLRIIYAWGCQPQEFGSEYENTEKALNGTYLGLLHLTKVISREFPQLMAEITVLSRGLFDVSGNEQALNSIQALALGPVKVIPQEYPQISCRLIDLDPNDCSFATALQGLDWGAEKTIGSAAEKMQQQIIAARNGHYWLPIIEPLQLNAPSEIEEPLTQRGVYFITGGLGGLGLTLATQLANQYQACLALTTRSEIPNKEQWPEIIKTHKAQQNEAFKQFTQKVVEQLQQLQKQLAIPGIDSYAGLRGTLEQLCNSYLLGFFEDSGISTKPGKTWTIDEIGQKINILPKFEKFLLLLLEILQRDAVLSFYTHESGQTAIRFLSDSNQTPTQQIQRLQQQIENDYPGFAPLCEMLSHCVAHYHDALSGKIEAISVLYPDGDRSLISETGEKTIEHSNHRVYYNLLKEQVVNEVQSSDDCIRILEIGGGSGVLTGIIVPELQQLYLQGKAIEYYFTDIGKSFVMKVQKQAQQEGYDFMHFSVLDISADPVAQGLQALSFDIIYGLDVVHATPHISQTLQQLNKLLKPGGDIYLVETTPIPRWYEMVWGLAEGWWYYDDDQHRNGTTPLLTTQEWQQLMHDTQLFEQVAALPIQPQQREHTDCSLIMARKSGQQLTGKNSRNREMAETIETLLALEATGAQLEVYQADVTDREQMQAALAQAEKRFGAINGIFHTAASDSRGYINLQDKARSVREIYPKVLGTQVLYTSIDFKRLDFVALFSSLNALTGGAGNIAYTAANNYLDAFAHFCRKYQKGNVYTFDWDRWQSIGQAIEFEQRQKQLEDDDLTGGISALEGFQALRRGLCSEIPQLLITARREPAETFSTDENLGKDDETETLPHGSAGRHGSPTTVDSIRDNSIQTNKKHRRPQLAQAYIAPENQMQELIAQIWSDVLGIAEIGINDDFSALGGDSLIAIRMIARLKESLQLNLEVKLAFEYQTIAELAAYLDTLKIAMALSSDQASQPVPELQSSQDLDEQTEFEGGVI